MGFGNYPPGFSGDMLESYFEEIDNQPCCQNCREYEEPDRYCENCMYYEERTCGMICGVLEAEYSETALGDMSDEEYMAKFGKQPDDCCNDHEFWED